MCVFLSVVHVAVILLRSRRMRRVPFCEIACRPFAPTGFVSSMIPSANDAANVKSCFGVVEDGSDGAVG